MPTKYRRAVEAEREIQAIALLRDGLGAIETAARTGLPLADVKVLVRMLEDDEPPPPCLHPEPHVAVVSTSQQRAECVRHLGRPLAFGLAPRGEPVEVQRLYAALRCALLDADDLVPVVRGALRERTRRQAVEAAHNPIEPFGLRVRRGGGKRSVVRGTGEGQS